MTNLQGKGYWTWRLKYCEGGNPVLAVQAARDAQLTHVMVKVIDGARRFNEDYAADFINAFKAANILPIGWGYSYSTIGGVSVSYEGEAIAKRILELNLDAYVVDAEAQYKAPGSGNYAKALYKSITDNLGERAAYVLIGFSSYRYPKSHPEFPWRDFILTYDFAMPQVYWAEAHNAGEQLEESLSQYKELFAKYRELPYYPVGATYTEHGWTPTTTEVQDFLVTAQRLNLPAVNFWEWSDARNIEALQPLWETVANYAWGEPPPPPPPLAPPIGMLEVMADVMRLRTSPGLTGALIGYAHKGCTLYAFEVVKDIKGYTWGRVGVNAWIAISSPITVFCRWFV